MKMLTDIEISSQCQLKDIREIAKTLGLKEEDLELYGKYKAKIPCKKDLKSKLILVTAINPTASGEGKTTVSIGLADGLKQRNQKVWT